MHNAGIKWFVVVWPTVLTSCTVEIPGLDDKAILVEYKVFDVAVKNKYTILVRFQTCFNNFLEQDSANSVMGKIQSLENCPTQ